MPNHHSYRYGNRRPPRPPYRPGPPPPPPLPPYGYYPAYPPLWVLPFLGGPRR